MEHIIAQDSKIKYIPSFDSLRGLAALFVLLLHGSYGFFSGGFIGVDLFFVLSGYLITSILYHEYRTTNGISFSKFYIRRAIRLFPPLLICIGLANLLWYFGLAKPAGNEILATVASLFYFSNYISGAFLGNMAHLWSLSVEEHFYLFWPLLMVFFVFRAPDKNRMYFFIFILVLIALMRVFLFNHEVNSGAFMLHADRFTLTRMDGMILGALLSFSSPAPMDGGDKRWNGTLTLIGIGITFMIILFSLSETNHFFNNGGFILTNLLCALTVYFAIRFADNSLFSNKILNWIGKRSYGLYVYHFPIFLWTESFRVPHDNKNLLMITILRLILSFAITAVSYTYIEKPILKFKSKF